MSTRKQMMSAFLSNSSDPKFGKVSAIGSTRGVLDCGPNERGAATWIPQHRDKVPVEALQRVWRGRRRDGVPE